MPAPDFRSGEVVTWTARGDDPTDPYRENRPVFFVAFEDAENALVSYGMRDGQPRHIRVPVVELSRVEPEAHDPTNFPNGKPFSTPRPATPLSSDQLGQRLAAARNAPRVAHERASQAEEDVAAARGVADRGADELGKVQAELRLLREHEVEHDRELEAALRQGRDTRSIVNGSGNRTALEARLAATESAAATFNAELAEANRHLTDTLDQVKVAARAIIAVVVAVEADELRREIAQVCARHSELNAVAAVRFGGAINPLSLDRASTELLSNGVLAYKEHPAAFGVGQDFWSQRWRTLFGKLLDGEIEAELAPREQ
jgi:hypothetical protein